MSFKEIYLSVDTMDEEISMLKKEIDTSLKKIHLWEASFNQSALIVTDLQNYFLSPKSHAFIPSAPAILRNIRLLVSVFTDLKRPVIFTRHVNDPENAGSMGYWWADLVGEGTWLSGLTDEFKPVSGCILDKHQYDAFHGTKLEEMLQSEHVRFPVICGVMANLCCETTVRSAFVRGFRPVLPLDATAAYTRQMHIATFRNLAFGFSPLLTTRQVIEKLAP